MVVESLDGYKIKHMKLSKKKEIRCEKYLDMLQFNCDVFTLFTKETIDNMVVELEMIIKTKKYTKNESKVLNSLERTYQNWVIGKQRIFTK